MDADDDEMTVDAEEEEIADYCLDPMQIDDDALDRLVDSTWLRLMQMSPKAAIETLMKLWWQMDEAELMVVVRSLARMHRHAHSERFGFVSMGVEGPFTELTCLLYSFIVQIWTTNTASEHQAGTRVDLHRELTRTLSTMLPATNLVSDLKWADDDSSPVKHDIVEEQDAYRFRAMLTHGHCYSSTIGYRQRFCGGEEEWEDYTDDDDEPPGPHCDDDDGCSDAAILVQALLHQSRTEVLRLRKADKIMSVLDKAAPGSQQDYPESPGQESVMFRLKQAVLELPRIKAQLRTQLTMHIGTLLPELWDVVCDYVFQHRWVPVDWQSTLHCTCKTAFPVSGAAAVLHWRHEEERACRRAERAHADALQSDDPEDWLFMDGWWWV